MSLLVIVWCGSLLSLLGIGVLVSFRVFIEKRVFSTSTVSFRDFVLDEYRFLARRCFLLLRNIAPHGRRAVDSILLREKKARDLFTERIFGHMEITRGKTSSFFLKHLVEHQESIRKDAEKKEIL